MTRYCIVYEKYEHIDLRPMESAHTLMVELSNPYTTYPFS